ncbi:MAG: gfo/Idh/MocA family oxidoreductase [Paenibacillus sp.]|jgi:predicted dehydrogenase|nr:gfo/Idh/MocA family oxidoreductase [Paenibacillus sp.]
MKKVKVGLIGCGQISGIYLKNCTQTFDILEVVACADLVPELARKQAGEFGVPRACSVDELLADPEIEIIINLTAPKVHAQINMKALEAGKHVYTEKPFALNREEADQVLALAETKGLRVGCAPDTFLGGGLQTCRKLIDDGWIGTPYAANGTIFMGGGSGGLHPNFQNFLRLGGDPLFDMGPYYLTAMVFLLGPIGSVSGFAAQLKQQITVDNPASPRYGETVPVEAPTNIAASLQFDNGVIAGLQAAKEGFKYTPRMEVYGTEGILYVPDPNNFSGPLMIKQQNGEVKEFPYSHGFTENSRGIGVADMAYAIRSGRAHRASGTLARHVLDVMIGIHESAETGRHVAVKASCDRPAPLPLGLKYNVLDA